MTKDMNVKFLSKIAELKKETGKLSKDCTNPFFNSKYFDINQLLEHLEPICEAKGLLILQPIIDGKVYSQIIDLETGECKESAIEIPAYTDPQKTGSAITYFRRYTLQSLLGLQAEDDDANKSAGRTQKTNNGSTANKNDGGSKNTNNSEDKPWLNLTDKDGNMTEVFKKIIKRAESETITVAELKKYFKISKESVKLLAEKNIV